MLAAVSVASALAMNAVQSGEAQAGELKAQPGQYDDGLVLAYDPSARLITGYYHGESGQRADGGSQFSCIFYFAGVLNGSTAAIRSYFPETPGEVIEGVFSLDAPGELTVTLKDEHGGCWNVWRFADKDMPARFTLSAARPWKALRVIKSDRAHFYDSPDATYSRKGYVVKGDALGVKSSENGWLEVDYANGAKVISGWIKESEFFPAP